MLYITKYDGCIMGLSSVSHDIGDVDAMYPLSYSMMSTNPMGGSHPGLVSILHNTEKKNLVNVRAPETISLNGIIYDTARELAIVFNRDMVCEEELTTTTTEALITTTTTPTGDVPEGAIQFEGTSTYVQFETGEYVIFEEPETVPEGALMFENTNIYATFDDGKYVTFE